MSNAAGVNLTQPEDIAAQVVYESLGPLQDLVDGKFSEGYVATHFAMLAGCVQACATFYRGERPSGDTAFIDNLVAVTNLLATRLDTISDAVDGLLERERGEGYCPTAGLAP